MIYVIKKDGTREKFNVEKIINAVNKSANRILYTFTEEEKRKICDFAFTKAESLGRENIDIQDMHNIVEGALEQVNPAVARSYRDYRNYKKDFVHMMDDVYTKSNIIANPNCSTIQSVLPLKAINDAFGIKRVVYTTYQAVSGSGQKGVNDLANCKNGKLLSLPTLASSSPNAGAI